MNPDRFESYPVWNYKRNGDPTMDDIHSVNKKRRAVRRRDKKRDRLVTLRVLMDRIADIKVICEKY